MARKLFSSRCFAIFTLIMAAIGITACSSTKEVSEADIMKHAYAAELMQKQQFVVKANRLMLDKHTFNSISSATNFIKVEGDKATVQVSPGYTGGPNGVGGFTVEGTISGYSADVRANGEVKVKFNVNALVGSCSVYINLPKNGINATATVHSTFRGRNATIYGTIEGIDNSIFVGRTQYK